MATCVEISAEDIHTIVNFAHENKIDFVIVGPEVPLVMGLVNELTGVGIKAFGPTKEAAVLEGSKAFMKNLCKKNNIPTANFGVFNNYIA